MTPLASLRISSIVLVLLGLSTLAEVPVGFLRQTPTGKDIAPGVQVRGGAVPSCLREHDDDGIRPNLFDELGTDPLHGSVLVG